MNAKILFASLLVAICSLSFAEGAPRARPNILFIMTDDHAAHAMSCYGSVVNQTPNMDRIAREGMRFDRCFVVNSICTPSRASILTGKYSHRNGTPVFNAGMRGGKNTPYLGGTRVPSFWRWPGGFKGGVDCDRLTAHLDVFPTLVEVAGAAMNRVPRNQVEGRSLLPLLKNPEANWPERMLVTHIGRWEKGAVSGAKYQNCSIRTKDFQLVSAPGPKQDAAVPRWQLFNLQNDRAETSNVIGEHPEIARRMAEAYEDWWRNVQPGLVNEDVVAPKVNPFKALYWQQLGGGPDEALRRQMDPSAANLK
jgi:arylsulfatase A-like enzyme